MIEGEDWNRVAVDQGIVTKATRTDRSGTHALPDQVGKLTFFVSVVDDIGNTLILWEGWSFPEAVRAAREASRDFGVPIEGLTVGGSG